MADDMGKYLQEGRQLAAILGPTFNRAFGLREKHLDEHIKSCVEARRSGMICLATFSAAETSATPDEVDMDSKKVKGMGRGRRRKRMSNSQGL